MFSNRLHEQYAIFPTWYHKSGFEIPLFMYDVFVSVLFTFHNDLKL